MIIGVTGLIGYETARRLCLENEEIVKQRFPDFWIEKVRFLGQIDIEKLYENLYTMKMRNEITDFREIGEGGLFGALWEACSEFEKVDSEENSHHKTCGCQVFIKQIPVCQQVVELCELFDVNPYEVPSKGAFLVFGEDKYFGNGSPDIPEPFNIRFIGQITDKKERVLIMGQDEKTGEPRKRFLTPPERQKKDLENSKRK